MKVKDIKKLMFNIKELSKWYPKKIVCIVMLWRSLQWFWSSHLTKKNSQVKLTPLVHPIPNTLGILVISHIFCSAYSCIQLSVRLSASVIQWDGQIKSNVQHNNNMWIDRGFIGESFVVPFFHDSREIKFLKKRIWKKNWTWEKDKGKN